MRTDQKKLDPSPVETILMRYLLPSLFFAGLIFFCVAPVSGQDIEETFNGEETVTCENGFLSVQAKDIRPEDLMKEIGEKCNIEIVVQGEVFSEIPVSSRFDQMPLRDGVKRVLRCSGITNHLMHFSSGDNGTKIVRLDLIGKKGGEKRLTDRTVKRESERARKVRERVKARREARKKARKEPPISKAEMEDLQQSFMNVMDDVLKEKFMSGEQPDPQEVLRIFNEAVPPDIREKMPPEVLEQLEGLR